MAGWAHAVVRWVVWGMQGGCRTRRQLVQNAGQPQAGTCSSFEAAACELAAGAHPPAPAPAPLCAPQVQVESAGDAAGDAEAVEEKLLSLAKGQSKLKVLPVLVLCAAAAAAAGAVAAGLPLPAAACPLLLPPLAAPSAVPTNPPASGRLPRLPPPRAVQVVADRGLQRGDLAIVDFSAKRADTGEELVGATRSSMRLDTDDADKTFLPGAWGWGEGYTWAVWAAVWGGAVWRGGTGCGKKLTPPRACARLQPACNPPA